MITENNNNNNKNKVGKKETKKGRMAGGACDTNLGTGTEFDRGNVHLYSGHMKVSTNRWWERIRYKFRQLLLYKRNLSRNFWYSEACHCPMSQHACSSCNCPQQNANLPCQVQSDSLAAPAETCCGLGNFSVEAGAALTVGYREGACTRSVTGPMQDALTLGQRTSVPSTGELVSVPYQ